MREFANRDKGRRDTISKRRGEKLYDEGEEKKKKKGKKISVERDRYVRIQLRRILALSLKFKTARVNRYQPLPPSFFPPVTPPRKSSPRSLKKKKKEEKVG